MKQTVRVGGIVGAVVLLALLVVEMPLPSGDDLETPAQEPVAGAPTGPQVVLRSRGGGSENSECLALAGSPASNSRLMVKNQWTDVWAFFGSLEKQGFDTLQRQLVADLAGLDPFAAESRYRSPRNPSYANTLLPAPDAGSVNFATRRRLVDALNSPGIQEWIREVQNDPAVLRHRWIGSVPHGSSFEAWHSSVLGHALRTRTADVQAHWRDLPAGSFGLHELAVAIEVAMPADRFLDALDRSAVDPGESWRHHRLRRDVNLSVVAVFNARPAILRALMARGVEPSSTGHSVLDEVAASAAIARESMADIVRLLAGSNDQPFFPSTIETLKGRFPMIPELVLHPDSMDVLATGGIESVAEQLAAVSGRWDGKVAEAHRVERRCRDIWLDATEVSPQSLAGKLRRQEESNQRSARAFGEVAQEATGVLEDVDPAFLASIEPLRKALADNEWLDVLRLADETAAMLPDGVDEDLHLFLLRAALRSGAPLDILRAMIDRTGGSLPRDAIMTLVGSNRNGSMATAAELDNLFGLDFHFVDDHGRNAVGKVVDMFRNYSLEGSSDVVNQRTLRWLDYLTSRSVTTNPSRLGLDPLDKVLLVILENPAAAPAGIGVARLLIDNGALIELSHRQLVDQIRSADSDLFKLLVAGIPVLGTSEVRP